MRGLWIFLNVAFVYSQTSKYESCRTPDGKLGECKAISQCHYISVMAEQSLSYSTIMFLKKSQCGFEGRNPKVCCMDEYDDNRKEDTLPTSEDGYMAGIPASSTKERPPVYPSVTKPDATFPVSSRSLLPDRSVCGTATENRIVGGQVAELDEFPWMALIEYRKPSGSGFHCGGVLISKRYILTAAHCVKGRDLPKTWQISNVRLGEYNTQTAKDCIPQSGYEYCSDPPLDVAVSEVVVHEMYDPFDQNQYHDIALLRLEYDVQFTTFIKPICLPTSEKLQGNYVGINMTVAGWGKTETKSESKVKLKLQVPVRSMDECGPVYSTKNVKLSKGQLCAGGIEGKDSCRGDSGGPLMTLYYVPSDYNWYATGVVSFGPSPCGVAGWPGVYTKVSEYIPWILKTIKA
uniref:CLIP domain-containing serine protease n=1 Tax=Photinus pyralis TaxID=7054 RepID=A0A1Y1L107_PHOPY